MQDSRDVPNTGLPLKVRSWSTLKMSSWKKYLQSFDILISGRIHGGMMGIYAGIPTIIVSDDYRIRELSEQMFLLPSKNV